MAIPSQCSRRMCSPCPRLMGRALLWPVHFAMSALLHWKHPLLSCLTAKPGPMHPAGKLAASPWTVSHNPEELHELSHLWLCIEELKGFPQTVGDTALQLSACELAPRLIGMQHVPVLQGQCQRAKRLFCQSITGQGMSLMSLSRWHHACMLPSSDASQIILL